VLSIYLKEVIRARICFHGVGNPGMKSDSYRSERGSRRHSSGKLREMREYSCRLYRRIRSGEHSFSLTNAKAESYIHTRARGANAEGSYLEMSREDFPLHPISSFFLLGLTLSWRFECAASIRAFLL